MLRTGRHFFAALSLLLVSFMPYIVSAGDTINDFDAAGTPFSVTQNGNAPGPVAGPTGNYYRLTEAINGQHNFIAFDRTQNPDRSQTITADFDFRLGEGSNPPADGLGFALIDVGADTGGFSWGAAETPAANEIVVGVGFHVYNGALDSRITLHNRNGEFASVNTNNLPANAFPLWRGDIDPATAAFDHCRVTVDLIAQTVTVVITPASSGTPVTVINNQSIPGLVPFKWRAAFGGRTGGLNTEIAIDNVNITSTTIGEDVVAPTITAVPDVQFFSTSVDATITNNEAGGTTYYTTDGSLPSATNGTPVTTSATITISTTTRVRARTFNGAKSPVETERTFTLLRTADTPTGATASGVRGRYYRQQGFNNNPLPDFPNLTHVIQAVKPKFLHDNNDNPFEPQAVRENDYSIRYTGYINAPTDGVYTFYASSDDGSRVLIGNTVVVNNNAYQGFGNFVSGQIGLRQGLHAIEVQFAEGGGDARLQVDWEGPGVAREEVPTSVLTTEPAAENPIISILGGNTFAGQATVTISSSSGDANVIPTIYYTLDGSDPSPASFAGTFPSGGTFNITQTTTVRAIAIVSAPASSSPLSASTFTRTDPPSTLLSAAATSTTNVDVFFSSGVDASGNTAANFTIDQGVTVNAAAVDGTDSRIVHLTVSPALTTGTLYTVTVNNIQTTAAGAVANGSTATFRRGATGVLFERYNGTNNTIGSLRALGSFPASPSESRVIPRLSFANLGDNYGTRMQALLVVTVAGNYQFRVVGDDDTEVYLNATGTAPVGPPVNADPFIAGFTGATAIDNYGQFPTQTSAVIPLAVGEYYIMTQHAEGGGGDFVNVQWLVPGAAGFSDIPTDSLKPTGNIPTTVPGLLRERYDNIGGTAIGDLTGNAKYPNSPDAIDVVATSESFQLGDNYGLRLRGYFVPGASGNYRFYVGGDDDCRLFLSTNNLVDNAVQICEKTGGPYGNRDWVGEPDQKSNPIALVAGQQYYVFALMKEGGGGDGLAFTASIVEDPTDVDPANGTDVLPAAQPGSVLLPDFSGVPAFQILTSPSSKNVLFGTNTTLSVSARGALLSYQWFKDNQPISGAVNPTLNLNNVTGAATGAYFCKVYSKFDGLNQSEASSAAANVQVFANIALDTATLSQTFNATPRVVTATVSSTLPYSVTYDGSTTAPTNAGTYAIVATVTEPGVAGTVNGSLVVAQATATINVTNNTVDYDGTAKTVNFTTTPPGLNVTITNSPAINAGVYNQTVTVNDTNVSNTPSGSATLTINQVVATINVTNNTVDYDGTAKTVNFTTTPPGLTVTITPNTPAINAGVYNQTVTVNDANASNAPSGSATLTINAATASITVTDNTVVYDGTAKTVNFVTTPAGLNVTITNTPTVDVGSVVQMVTVNDPNASNSPSGSATLTITQRPLTITANDLSREYGDANPATTLSYSGFATGEDETDLDTLPTATIAGTATATANAGTTHAITLAGGADVNYAYTLVSGTLTITKATVTVTAPNASRGFGRPNPAVTLQFANFKNGETETVIDTLPTVTFAATANAAATVGSTHAITPSGGADVNYNLTFVNGVLTITTVNDATVTLTNTSKVFTGSALAIDFVTSPAGLNVDLVYTQNGQPVSPIAVGSYTVTGTINDVRSGTAPAPTSTATLSIVAPPPTLGSGLSANRNPATVGVPVTFTLPATSPIGLPLTITYDYGDGTSDTTGVHTYTIPTVVTVTATVQDGVNTVTATLSLTVIAAASPDGDADGDGVINSQDTDDDGDGVSDALETALGTDPSSAGSSPLTDPSQGQNPGPLTVGKMSISLNFSKAGNDSVALSGTLAVPAGFVTANQKVAVDVGGVVKSFTLDAKGKSPKGVDSFKVTIKAKKGVVAAQTAKYMVKFGKSSYAATLASSSNLTSGDFKNVSRPVTVNVIFNGTYLRKIQPQTYSAKTGKTGKTK